jgi:glycine hydroxymethyltransferase
VAGITLNKNTIPQEPVSAFYPSGIRLGTPIMTMRGMKETEMKKVAEFIFRASEEVKNFSHLGTKEERLEQMKQFKEYIANNTALKEIKKEVALLCLDFPIYK